MTDSNHERYEVADVVPGCCDGPPFLASSSPFRMP